MTTVSTHIAENKLNLQGPLIVETVTELLSEIPQCPLEVSEISLMGASELDSAGLALLVLWESQIKQKGGTVAFVDVPPQAANLMLISGLQHMISSASSAD
ncbi:MAG: STAS domain-containing protein [Acidiferrobacterales bacterium]|nr:STAS domain-containing protein [Acidiferrobacterales bacterium]